ncbi:MAG TPA: ATP-binding protein [Gemmatimonadaceae bacterium]|nr:ATP-binding protein [Gemmatimonadaceae bacterium]
MIDRSASDRDGEDLEHRVLFLSPSPKDAALTESVLARAGVACQCHGNIGALCAELDRGAGAVLMAEEFLAGDETDELVRWISRQPSWSDLPLLIFARTGADSVNVTRAMDLLGNVTVIERPLRISSLVSAVRTALRARARQYQIRDQLAEREEAARQLKDSVDEMQALLDTLPVPVYIAHDRGADQITGNRAAGEIRMSNPEIAVLRRAARGEEVRGEETSRVIDDDTIVHSVVWATPLFGSDGVPRGGVAAAVDITQLKRAEATLRDADRKKDDFLAMLAHELRNPLAPIRNALHVLRLTAGRNTPAEHVGDMLERQVSHMVRLVDDLLEVSRITRGKIALRREIMDVRAVVQNAIDISRPLIDAAGLEFTVKLPDERLTLDADPARVAQIIANLLNNSAKYTDRGGSISLTVDRHDGQAVITVRDSGMGISIEMLPHVFDLFTQADQESERVQGGLGIGLTLVKKLVELHGGTVTAWSEGKGKGSEFVVRLPLARTTPPASRVVKETSMPRLPGLRVLVVDDNRDAAESLAMVVKMLAADARVTFSGTEALAVLEEYRPNVMLLDIGMRVMDGYEVARRVRAHPDFKDITLIALTGWGQDEDRRRSRAAGFDYHLIKPADIDALQVLLSSVEVKAAR